MRLFIATIFILTVIASTAQPGSAGEQKDFALHAGVCFVLSTLSYNVYKDAFDMSGRNARVAAFVTAMAIGTVKELVDDEVSGSDMAGNALGAGVGVVIGFDF